MIKASIIFANYNHELELPNTLYSISRQKTNFEFEVCIVDDCSLLDPRSIIQKYLKVKHYKYTRLLQHIGCLTNTTNFPHFKLVSSFGMSLLMTSPESEVIVITGADVIWPKDDILQKMVDRMQPKKIQLYYLRDMNVNPNLHLRFEHGIDKLLNRDFNDNFFMDYMCPNKRDGVLPGNLSYQTLFMPLYRNDLMTNLEYTNCANDIQLSVLLHQQGYTPDPEYPDPKTDVIGIHQHHPVVPSVLTLAQDQLVKWGFDCPYREDYIYGYGA